ncbi:MAG: hypothetical protein LBG88_01880 [Christensenellaceae bacterium]|jgi:dephospho-CoA kinase|nr:hypothetical protein [Christensenellaceae bacterium]
MKREKTVFRQNATLAKARLANGFWNGAHKKANLENINNLNGEEEQIYRRVETALRDGDGNPLATLLDQDYMSNLDDAERQRYVLNMSFRVNKSIERYNKVC